MATARHATYDDEDLVHLYLVDIASKKVHDIMYAALSARTGEMLGAASLSPDERTLYFAQGTIEADIWMLTGN